jgi:hypothetical protein
MNVVIALMILILLAVILIPMLGLRRKSEARQQEICKGNDEGVLMV